MIRKTQPLNKWMALRRSLRRRANRDPSPMKVSIVDNHDRNRPLEPVKRKVMQMLKDSGKYVEKSTRSISRIEECGPPKGLNAVRTTKPDICSFGKI
ncbi:hypothetical protein AVEN_25914-1 [Araneus ventricosus]|uniref:Uncharacterized protein n=1 Tax=Araneus ventricosus TaxID=182803 RepID=A0A4Y2UY07_ARAVE|nr:hypothetical protein AVEN_25914-1 [Araneus ventricosus]